MDTAQLITIVAAAVLAVFSSITAPLVLIFFTERARRQEKLMDYAREDSKAAALLAATAKVEKAAEAANGKLDVIHTLVNSQLTAALQSELDAVTRELAMMREVVALNRAAGRAATPEALAAIEAATVKITELAAVMADRHLAAEQVTRQERDGP